MKKNFLVGGDYAIIKVVSQRGFGKISKGIDLETEEIVAIKERIGDSENLVEISRHEKYMLQYINARCKGLESPKYIYSMDYKSSPNKFLVMEWVKGHNLLYLHSKKLNSFSNQFHFVCMMKILLHQLAILHNANILHRDIKPGKKLFFFFF